METTFAQKKAIDLARKNDGFVAAGHNVVGGRQYSVNARVLDALVRKGIAEACYDGDGGYAVRLTARGSWVGGGS